MMEIIDAVDLYQQYLLVEKGLSKQTVISYIEDLKQYLNIFDILKIEERETIRFGNKKNYIIFIVKNN